MMDFQQTANSRYEFSLTMISELVLPVLPEQLHR
jgi:hypothetical protein